MQLGTGTVTSGTATYSTSALNVGTYTFTARFLPANPAVVKPATANAISGYNVSANLGFTAAFTTDANPVTTTDNGKEFILYGGGAW